MECVGYDNTFQLELSCLVPPLQRQNLTQSLGEKIHRKYVNGREGNRDLDVNLHSKDEDKSQSQAAEW